ncbi:MAG: hypothetical protein WC956_05320 [bacterium]
MRMRLFSAAIVLIISVPFVAHASAVLLDAKGSVSVTLLGNKPSPAKIGLELPDGSVLKVGKGGKASVMLDTGAVDEITGEASYTVGPKAKSSKRTELGNGVRVAMRELSAGGPNPTVHGMVKEAGGPASKMPSLDAFGAGGLRAIYPIGTAIRLGPTISFRWEGAQNVKWPEPVIVIDDASQKHVAVKAIRPGSSEYSASPKELGLAAGGRYTWYLASNKGGVAGKTSRFEFTTISQADERALDTDIAKAKSLEMSQDGKELLAAQLFYQRGMYDDMVRKLAPLWQRTRAPFVGKLLKYGYSQMGRGKEAAGFQ